MMRLERCSHAPGTSFAAARAVQVERRQALLAKREQVEPGSPEHEQLEAEIAETNRRILGHSASSPQARDDLRRERRRQRWEARDADHA